MFQQIILFYQKYVHLGRETSIHCGLITVKLAHANNFVSNSPNMPQQCQKESARSKSQDQWKKTKFEEHSELIVQDNQL